MNYLEPEDFPFLLSERMIGNKIIEFKMTNKIIAGFILIVMLAGCVVKPVKSINYYFDPILGNDSNTGTTPSEPFRSFAKINTLKVAPGDSILLKSGAVFTQKLYFSGKGSKEKPVVIGKYGGNDKPYLKGNATSLEMVHIYNSEHIVVRDLEISNKGEKPRAYLTGLMVELHNYGKARDITIENIYVHDVYGSLLKGDGYQRDDVGSGQAVLFRNLSGSEKDSIPSCFDGLLVQHCLIKNSQRNGIMMWGNWVRKYWYPNLNVIIRNNVLDGVPGDGIVPVGCEAPLVEYNVMKNCPAVLPPTEACDGIWPWSCDNAVIQYNVVSDHKSQVDGYGFDSDYNCTNSLFQYNLSFNNDGGFLLLCNSGGWPHDYSVGNRNTVVRYNISINDGIRNHTVKGKKGYFSPVIHITGNTQNSIIEYNLFYIGEKPFNLSDKRMVCSDDWNGYADSTFFVKNYIFAEELNVAFDPTKSTNNFFEGNLYIGNLAIPGVGFSNYNGRFDKKMWYNPNDDNWNKLLEFIKDKTVVINGKEKKVVELIGWKK